MDEIERGKLWEKYAKTKDPQIKDILIVEYAQLVKFVAGRLSMYLGNNVEFDDLTSYGVFGLIDAIDKFDCTKGIKFETYASLRIRGAILDNIRKMDWIPRSVRKKQKMIDQAMNKIESEYGIDSTDQLVAKELEISVDEYYRWQDQTKALNITSFEEFVEQGGDVHSGHQQERFDQPEEAIEQEEVKKMLVQAIEGLTDKERRVITLYYYEEMTLKEIAMVMDVSESRISQLHTKSLKKMKGVMGQYMGILNI